MDTDDFAVASTDSMFATMHQDSLHQDDAPNMFVGDLNASIGRLPEVQDLINNGQLIDLGQVASQWKAHKT